MARTASMSVRNNLIEQILNVKPEGFETLAVEIYRYQFKNNPVYHRFCSLLGKTPAYTTEIKEIPFMPVGFFKNHLVSSYDGRPEIIFESSSTTGQIPGRSPLYDTTLYHSVAVRGFEYATGKSPSEFEWLALLPSYLERPNASLVFMVEHFIKMGGGSFFSSNHNALAVRLEENMEKGKPTVLIGVSFALLDFAEQIDINLDNVHVIETGGMKGRRTEITRVELHKKLVNALHVDTIGSEYGMTELTSQAWSAGSGIYTAAPTLRIVVRELNDPLSNAQAGQRGALNCIDLANIDTCSFIATDDIGICHKDGTFEVLGRIDGSEQRGCNLMVSDL